MSTAKWQNIAGSKNFFTCYGQDVDEEQSIKESFDFQGEFLKFLKSSDSDFSSTKSPEEVNP